MYKIAILFSLNILLPSSLSGQSYIIESYNVKDGLPSNAMRSINEDLDGNIWLVTDNGIARYNGSFFKVYNSFANLKSRAVFDIFPSSDGRVYLIDYVKGLNYIYKDSLYTLRAGDVHLLYPTEHKSRVYAEDRDGNIYVIGKDSIAKLLNIIDSGIIKRMPKKEFQDIAYPYAFAKEGNTVTAFNLITCKVTTATCIQKGASLVDYHSFLFHERIYFINNEIIICYDPARDAIMQKHLTNSTSIAYNVKQLIFHRETIQMTTENGVVVMDIDLDQIDSLRIDVRKEGIISMFRDSKKNFWLLTNNGLKYISSYFRNLTHYAQGDIKRMAFFDGQFYAVTGHGLISVYDSVMKLQRNIIVEDAFDNPNNSFFYRLLDMKDSLVVATHRNITIVKKGGKIYSLRSSNLGRDIMYTIKDIAYSDKSLNVLTADGLSQVDVLSNKINYSSIGRFTHIINGSNDSFFVFTSDLSYFLENGKLLPYNNRLLDTMRETTGFSIPDFITFGDNNWMAVTNSEVCFLNTKSSNLSYYKLNDKAIFTKYENNNLWVATMSMLYKYARDADGEYHLRSNYYNFAYGLYQGLLDVTSTGDHFFLVSNYGVTKVPQKNETKCDTDHFSDISISRIAYGKKNHYSDKSGMIAMGYQPSNILIYFSCNTLGYDRDVTYRSYMEGVDKQWQSTSSYFATYPSLTPGTYRLHYYASLEKYGLHSKRHVIAITIFPLWWQHTIFKVVVIILILLVLGFVIIKILLNRKNRMLRKALIERNMSNVKLSALQSQMNPHFIFNAMTSIQGFLKQNRNYVAEECLTEFSRLIRAYLEFSSKQLISLAQELETLKLYASIEKKRFEGRFDVEIDVRTERELNEINIPPLIIQPFVENAIVHGLYHKLNGRGLLKVTIKEEGGLLTVVVDDNGIGRQKANSINALMGKNASKGLELISERIRILNENSIIMINIDTVDKENIDGEPEGVRVEIEIRN